MEVLMEHNEGHPIILANFYTMYEDGDEEGCKVGVEIHSAGTDKEQVIAILQKYIETDVEQLREMCEENTWISMYMKQRAECEAIYQELKSAGADVAFIDEEAEETEL